MMAGGGNLSAVFQKPKEDFRVVDAPIPEPKDNEVLMAVHSVGICGTDVHLWKDGDIAGRFRADPNLIFGHEFSATVVKLGSNAKRLKIGDRVVVDPSAVCRSAYCNQCSIGRYNLCPNIISTGSSGKSGCDGALRRFHTCLEEQCHKLPDNVTMEEGAFVEPLSIAVHACRRGNVAYGTTVLIGGCGPIGMLCLMTAKALGATKICVTDVIASRLELAKKLGADLTLLINNEQPTDIAKKVEKLFGYQPDVTLECTGIDSSIQLGIFATKPGGIVVLAGLGDFLNKVSLVVTSLKELEIKGAILSPHSFPAAIELISSGKVDVKSLISHRFSLEDANKAFQLAVSRAPGTMKVFIQPGV